jgi:hypothetical protein
LEQCAGKIDGVRVNGDVDRGRRARAVEVRALHLDARHIPARTGGDFEVVGRLVVEWVERGFEVLRVRADRSGMVVLVVEDVPPCRPCRRREREYCECGCGEGDGE